MSGQIISVMFRINILENVTHSENWRNNFIVSGTENFLVASVLTSKRQMLFAEFSDLRCPSCKPNLYWVAL